MIARAPILAALIAAIGAVPASARPPAPLSTDTTRANIASTYGSGAFGTWTTDAGGLPDYRYTLDEQTAPEAAQPELNGSRDAWHQLGNDHVVADAFNHGYVQLWSQDRLYQWANHYEASGRHYAGGYGYLNVGGSAYSTAYADRAPGTSPIRDFGVGYARRRVTLAGVNVDEHVYAPFGDDPLLLHEITLRNTTTRPLRASWFEYWDVNPYFPGAHIHLGLHAPTYDPATHTLIVHQLPNPQALEPLTIFAAALSGPVQGFETDSAKFFGAGTRAAPAGVSADHLSDSIAAPALESSLGTTMFAYRAPLTLAPHQSVTLRYAYGVAHAEQIAQLVDKYRAATDPLAASQAAWAKFVPQASFGSGEGTKWLSRELQWDAYTLRSGATYEDCAGHHIISQGGYYQYDLDFQGAFRDPLQHILPLVYSDPWLAGDVLLYSAGEQPRVGGLIPYARISGCLPFHLGTSDDLDLWLMLAAAEYGLATRDTGFFDQQVKWSDIGQATLWEHLKRAFGHQELQRGPHGAYVVGATGDWSDLSTVFMQMTESTLVTAQAASIYPRLAELADLRGDGAFAAQLRATAAGLLRVLRGEWTARGWYARGYSLLNRIGTGAIYEEPQPWALLAGAATAEQARTLVANIRRYLTGIGAPGGPSPIGSSQSPTANDPGVTERSAPAAAGVGDNHAVFVGGSWFALNGALTWALGSLDQTVPGARDYAWDELLRNTLAAHATAYPGHWNGLLSVDDACRSWYSTSPAQCGIGLSTAYDTQIMHQPAWSLFATIKLAGIEPVADGYRITPHLPMPMFSLRLPNVGVAAAPGLVRGYVRPGRSGSVRLHVAPPPGTAPDHLAAFAAGHQVPYSLRDGLVVFDLPATAGRAADWALVKN